ncbi:MAG TPA: ParA family protein [Caulobacteraceae bacterium]|nr:ParA family protein [Caulobacteraceae bacterium]
MRTLAVIALKGGSGKTTVATHLALAAHLRGRAVMVADIDPQRSAHDVLSTRCGGGPAAVVASGATLLSAQFAAAGLRQDLFIVDTPAGAVEDVTEAVVLADLCLLVVRPTLLDLAGLARTLTLVRRLGKPALVVMNQAPVAREGVEPPLVKRALKGLDYMQAEVAPTILRFRTIYQTALETGRSAEEMNDVAAAAEIAALWGDVEAALARREHEAEAG